jgi:hypothetical protein
MIIINYLPAILSHKILSIVVKNKQVNQKYPEGIDQAEGCVSVPTLIKKEDLVVRNQNKLLTRRREMAVQFGFTDTKELAMQKQKALYQENKKHAENLETIKLESLHADKNFRRDQRLKNEKQNEMFHSHVSVGGGNSAASAVSTSGHSSINVNTLIGCKGGQSIGDKLLEDGNRKASSGKKGLSFN